MIDVGLLIGIKDLWQENLLRDYTLVVEGREFQVHKVVLAAVSKYFKAMLCEGFMESKTDRVEVKGFSAKIVSKLLDLIYTGDRRIIGDDTFEVLRCAMYLQMPLVAKFCVRKLLIEDLNVHNFLEILSILIEFAFHEEVKDLGKFIQTNWEAVMKDFNPEVVSYEAFCILIDSWKTAEWEMFLCIKSWISLDFQSRGAHVNDLMTRVRFCLIRPEEVESIEQMDIFSGTEGPWKELVENAARYHQLPINHKVLHKSEQSKVKKESTPYFFVAHENIVTYFALDEEKSWRKHEQKLPGIAEFSCTISVQVNNFLIVCTTSDDHQDWQVFDPRTIKWIKMVTMEEPKCEFALVHHNDHLYTVGGQYIREDPTCETERYSFQEDRWSLAPAIPVPLLEPAGCVLGDEVYISGGWIHTIGAVEDLQHSDQLYCLNLQSPVPEWERKASCLWKCVRQKMSVMKRRGEEVLVIIDLDLKLQFYSPSTDQWSTFTNEVVPDDFDREWLDESILLVKENFVFILNLFLPEGNDNVPDDEDSRHACLIWVIPDEGTNITEVFMADFPPLTEEETLRDYFGDMLAIPPQHCL